MERGLPEIAARLRTITDLAGIQEIVRTAARQLVRSHGATFVLRDGDHCFYADEDAISPLWKGQRFPLAECISGWSILNGQPAVVPDLELDARVPIEAYRPTFVRSLAVVPIGADRPVGAIGVYWAIRHVASPGELNFLIGLGALTAAALNRRGGTGERLDEQR